MCVCVCVYACVPPWLLAFGFRVRRVQGRAMAACPPWLSFHLIVETGGVSSATLRSPRGENAASGFRLG